jgi:Ser/Thr protein kinase RdoA (MazF antagonist)
MDARTPFAGLNPDRVLDAASEAGLTPDGSLFALNSYENRVYRLGRDDAPPVVLKFYRADRWSDAEILEEHAFALELAAAEIAVVAPLMLGTSTLAHHAGFRFAAFPLMAGGAPDLDRPEARELLGRTLGRIHAIGALRPFAARASLAGERLGTRARRVVLASGRLPEHMRGRYQQVSDELIEQIRWALGEGSDVRRIRIHGDCHLGNILWQSQGPSQGPVFVDLDDCVQGPAIQDLWMLLSGNPDERRGQWAELMAGYERFASFDHSQLRLIEPLRALRMLNHAAWIAERWADPAFPRAFPWFGEARYWEQHVLDLAEQGGALLDDPSGMA